MSNIWGSRDLLHPLLVTLNNQIIMWQKVICYQCHMPSRRVRSQLTFLPVTMPDRHGCKTDLFGNKSVTLLILQFTFHLLTKRKCNSVLVILHDCWNMGYLCWIILWFENNQGQNSLNHTEWNKKTWCWTKSKNIDVFSVYFYCILTHA